MAKELTPPTPPAAPPVAQVGINDRINGVHDRIQEIEDIGNFTGSRHSEEEEEPEESENQEEQPIKSEPVKEKKSPTKTVETPETMARDAVANGSGALTKRTTSSAKDKGDAAEDSQAANQNTVVIPPAAALVEESKSERGKAVLREFEQLDKESGADSSGNSKINQSSESPHLFSSSYESHVPHGGLYWVFTAVIVVVLSFFFIRQFMVKNKPQPVKLKNNRKLNANAGKVPAAKVRSAPLKSTPASKTIPKVKQEDEGKGKNFEIRV